MSFMASLVRNHLVSVTPDGWRVRSPRGAVIATGPEVGARGFSLARNALERALNPLVVPEVRS